MGLALLDTVQPPGVAVKALLAAGAVLLKPVLDSLLMSDSPVTGTLSGHIGDLIYSKDLTLLKPTPNGYQHVVPLVRTAKPIPSSMPLLQPPSTTVMFGLVICFLSLLAAGTFLVRTRANSQSGGPSSLPLRSLSETLAYNRQQRQAQDRMDVRRRSGRGPPNPSPPNNNYNIMPTQDIKPSRPEKRSQFKAGIGAPPPPPPPPPPPVAVHAEKAGGRKAGTNNTLWKCLFCFSVMALFVKYTSTSDRYCSDDISVDLDDTSSMPPIFSGPMELQHSPVALPSPLEPLLARFQAVHEVGRSFTPTVFTSPCLFLRLAMDYLVCTLLCWILSSVCALASCSACTGIHQEEVSKQDIHLPILTQEDQLEDLGSSEQVFDAPNITAMSIAAEDHMAALLVSEPDGDLPGPSSVERCIPPPGRTRRTRPRRHPNHNHALKTNQPIPV